MKKVKNTQFCTVRIGPDPFQGRIGWGVATARSACLFLVGSRDVRVNLHHPERGVAPVHRPQKRPGVARPHGLVARFCCVWPGLFVRRAFLSGIRSRSNAGLRRGYAQTSDWGREGFCPAEFAPQTPPNACFSKSCRMRRGCAASLPSLARLILGSAMGCIGTGWASRVQSTAF